MLFAYVYFYLPKGTEKMRGCLLLPSDLPVGMLLDWLKRSWRAKTSVASSSPRQGTHTPPHHSQLFEVCLMALMGTDRMLGTAANKPRRMGAARSISS
jgi:hypothetical protein